MIRLCVHCIDDGDVAGVIGAPGRDIRLMPVPMNKFVVVDLGVRCVNVRLADLTHREIAVHIGSRSTFLATPFSDSLSLSFKTSDVRWAPRRVAERTTNPRHV